MNKIDKYQIGDIVEFVYLSDEKYFGLGIIFGNIVGTIFPFRVYCLKTKRVFSFKETEINLYKPKTKAKVS